MSMKNKKRMVESSDSEQKEPVRASVPFKNKAFSSLEASGSGKKAAYSSFSKSGTGLVKKMNPGANNKKTRGNILVLCAHSDDQVLGAGGSIAKFEKEGYSVYTVIFSYGESSHPYVHLKHIAKTRVQEAKDADELLGGSGVFFLGLKDMKIEGDFQKKNMKNKLKRILEEYRPKKMFTHSEDDFMPDHRGVRRAVLSAYDELNSEGKLTSEVYSFDVWNIWNIKKRDLPVLVVDISPYFRMKIKALHVFKSQINVFTFTYLVNLLYLGVYVRAFINGVKYGFKLAEVFYRIR